MLVRSEVPVMLTERLVRRQAFACVGRQIALWWSRARERRALARLDDRQLKDIGLTRTAAAREVAKPFWQP